MLLLLLIPACRAPYYRKSADRQVYNIITDKQEQALGRTNDFTIDTRFSDRDPEDIPPEEIIGERLDTTEKQLLPVEDALLLALEHNRQYQLRKENLYLSALTLTRERHDFRPQLFAGSTLTGQRVPTPGSGGDYLARVNTRARASQFLQTGGSIGLNIANDLLRYYTGDPRRSAVSTISVNLFQPLLRGAGRKVAMESLTQAERNVIYEIRAFSHFQNTFTLDIFAAYLRLLQQQDSVWNAYQNYERLVDLRRRAQALAVDRGTQVQVDRAEQDELEARARYILAVERYLASVDQFKITLGLPLGVNLQLDPTLLEDLRHLGGLDLQILHIEDDAQLPGQGFQEVIVAIREDGRLHFRLFDDQGRQAADADETELADATDELIYLKDLLADVDQEELTRGQKRVIIDLVTAILDYSQIGLPPVLLDEMQGYQIAVSQRLDLLNEIDRFEDSKRRIGVAANLLKPDLNIFAEASIQSERPTDYASFNLDDWRGSAGIELNLPLDRLRERNAYRSSIITFERQLRTLALSLDEVRDRVRQGLRSLEQLHSSYIIQLNARELAERRVAGADLLFQAGRVDSREILEAQRSLLAARNAVTQALVDYHLSRLRLLLDLGVLQTDHPQFWAQAQPYSPIVDPEPLPPADRDEIISPDQLFQSL